LKKQLLLLALFPALLFAQNEKNACETLSKINDLIQNRHYKPKAVDGIPQQIVTKSVLEDFLLSGLLGLNVETNGYNSCQLRIIEEWYQSGTEKYEPNQSDYLSEILKMNGISVR
jgi:hypothetical protein